MSTYDDYVKSKHTFCTMYYQMLNCKHKVIKYLPITVNCKVCEYNDMCMAYYIFRSYADINRSAYINAHEKINECHNDEADRVFMEIREFRKNLKENYNKLMVDFVYACPILNDYINYCDEEDVYERTPNPVCRNCPKALTCRTAIDILAHEMFLEADNEDDNLRHYSEEINEYLETKAENKKRACNMYYIRGMKHIAEDYYEWKNKEGKTIFALRNNTGSIICFDRETGVQDNNSGNYNNNPYDYDIDREYLESVLDDSNDYFR